jgi:hypothetical protein
MRLISLFIASSLDGFITGSNESLEWLFTDQDYGYAAFFDAIDAAIMGRKTFDLACTFERVPYAGKAKYVFTRQTRTTDVPDVQFVSADPAELCRQLRAKSGKKIWLVGGSDIALCCSTLILSMRSCSRFIPYSLATASLCSQASGTSATGHWRSQRSFLRASYRSLTLVANDASHRNPPGLSSCIALSGSRECPVNPPDPNKAHEP